jgi:hypothetical protein
MRYRDMHNQFHGGCHTCAPPAWRRVPNVTGDYDLDASIGHSPNKDMAKKLSMYVTRQKYGYRTNYDSYGVGDD